MLQKGEHRMQEKPSRRLFGRPLNVLGTCRRSKQPSSSYYGSGPHTSQTRVLWFLILTLTAAILLIFFQPSTAQADGAAPHPLFAYDRQALHLGETTLIAQKFWWEDRLDPVTGKYRAVLTAELHLVRTDQDERVRVETGSIFTAGRDYYKVLEVNGNVTQSSYVVLQSQPLE